MVFVLWFTANDIADLTGDRSWEVASARQYHCEATRASIVPACAFAKSRHRRTPFYPNFPASSRTFRARASKFADGSQSLSCFGDIFRPAPFIVAKSGAPVTHLTVNSSTRGTCCSFGEHDDGNLRLPIDIAPCSSSLRYDHDPKPTQACAESHFPSSNRNTHVFPLFLQAASPRRSRQRQAAGRK